MALRVATAAVKPTRQHRDVVPNLAVSSQLGVSVFRYLSATCRLITTSHSTEEKASMRRSLTGRETNTAQAPGCGSRT